jgi:hypothetical protein
MGRRDLIRLAVLAGALAAASVAAAAATGVRWSVLVTGTTTPGGNQVPVGYVAVTRAQERRWLPRLSADDQRAVRRLDLTGAAAVAVFLDGLPCASHVGVTKVTRDRETLTVRFAYTPPPIGVATCVRTSTPYVVLAVTRKTLGTPPPTHVEVVARARA